MDGEVDGGVGGDGTDEAVYALEGEDGGEGVGKRFVEGPAAGDVVKGFVRWGGHGMVKWGWQTVFSDVEIVIVGYSVL